MIPQQALFDYVLRLGDSSLILGQRLSAWCAHAPTLEQDVAMVNIALDLIGQARSLLTYAGAIEGQGRREDDLAYLRDSRDWRNVLLVEQSKATLQKPWPGSFYTIPSAANFTPGWRAPKIARLPLSRPKQSRR
jgi:1,2-phenylacetyl-CoA epoxidase catalytic subunit